MIKNFPTTDILCLVTGYEMTPEQRQAVDVLVEHITGVSGNEHYAQILYRTAVRALINQLPWLKETRAQEAIRQLKYNLKKNRNCQGAYFAWWLGVMAKDFGQLMPVVAVSDEMRKELIETCTLTTGHRSTNPQFN